MDLGSPCSYDGTPRKDASKGICFFCFPALFSRFSLLLICLIEQIAIGGARSKDYFDRHGDLKRIRRLKYWPLDRLLIDKYKLPEVEAKEFAEFLTPILEFAPEKRPTAQQCLEHPWMNVTTQNNADNVDAQMNNLQIKG